ncbi:zinc-binding dehydrogenase [Streptomyces sp. Edi2]|uniref:zinc-binding dehydrogenase n=1 Tax=Streptomyces sp. Edi2 TaxID=3162528 RepID=UPI003305602B
MDSYVLHAERPGDMDSLAACPRLRRAPEPGEVEIEVRAAGVNFAHVLVVLGMGTVFGESEAHELGLDGVGTVVRVGSGAPGLHVGDRVLFFHEGAFASHVTVPTELVVAAPAALSDAEAATLPVAYLTAWYALVRLAGLGAGETALIQSAAGGVGLAAMNVARLYGARVLATSGTERKRQYLRELGVEHVLDSRSVAFADGVRETSPDGVDVVLNSLAGKAQQAGLGLLRLHGRFVEIGKRDIYGGGTVELAPFRRNISMHSVDLLLLSRVDRPLVQALLAELSPLWADGRLEPLAHEVYPMREAPTAIQTLTTGRHVGKVILIVDGP